VLAAPTPSRSARYAWVEHVLRDPATPVFTARKEARMRRLPTPAAAAAVLFASLAFTSGAHAQANWGDDAGRAVRPGAYVPYDGAPFSHRYNYYDFPYYFPGMSVRQFWIQYDLDRQDRFERFGTRYGPDHPPLFNRLLDRHRK
jgi:hypothetical protein